MKIQRRICLLLSALMVLTVLQGCKKTEGSPETQAPTAAAETQPPRQVREGIQTVLVCCTEPFDLAEDSGGFRNENRANFMMLMVIDEKSGQITPVQMNPDFRVSFGVPGKTEKTDMSVGNVCSYGSGGSDSSLNLLGAVSDLLGGVRIDHYLTFTMDAVAMVNDSIGGVGISDPTYFGDPSEEVVRLSGVDAVAYFSFRDAEDAENTARMERQHRYMRALYDPFLQKAQDDEFLSDLLLQLGDNMATDLTLSQLILMFETFEKYTMENDVYTVPGKLETAGDTAYYSVDADVIAAVLDQLIYE